MTRGPRRLLPLLLAGVVAPALFLTACSGAAPAGPGAPTSPRPALAPNVAAVPSTARQVTLSLNYGANAHGRKPPAPATITDAGKVSALGELVTHQPPPPPGTYNCPFADGMALNLTFRAHPGGAALATATLALNGCEGTYLAVGAKDYGLGHPASARSLAAKILKAAGLPWKLPPFMWPPGQ
jgi:hypothetical protein